MKQGQFSQEQIVSILHQEPKPFSEIVPSTPREVGRIVVQCLRKDPWRRFQHMEDVRVLLDSLREDAQSGRLDLIVVTALVAGLGKETMPLFVFGLGLVAIPRESSRRFPPLRPVVALGVGTFIAIVASSLSH